MRLVPLILVTLLPFFAQYVCAADDAVPPPRSVGAWVDVDATGQVTAVAIDDDVLDALADLARPTLSGFSFRPATKDGVAVPSRTRIQTVIAFSAADGDELEANVESHHQGVLRMTRRVFADYPQRAQRDRIAGAVSLDFDVRVDGSVDPASLRVLGAHFSRDGKDYTGPLAKTLLDAAREAAEQSRFELPQVAGEAVTVRVQMPMTFIPVGLESAEFNARAAERFPPVGPTPLAPGVVLPVLIEAAAETGGTP